MDLFSIVVTLLALALVGFLVWIITENVPMPPAYKQTIVVASVVLLVLYLLGVVTGHAPPLLRR